MRRPLASWNLERVPLPVEGSPGDGWANRRRQGLHTLHTTAVMLLNGVQHSARICAASSHHDPGRARHGGSVKLVSATAAQHIHSTCELSVELLLLQPALWQPTVVWPGKDGAKAAVVQRHRRGAASQRQAAAGQEGEATQLRQAGVAAVAQLGARSRKPLRSTLRTADLTASNPAEHAAIPGSRAFPVAVAALALPLRA